MVMSAWFKFGDDTVVKDCDSRIVQFLHTYFCQGVLDGGLRPTCGTYPKCLALKAVHEILAEACLAFSDQTIALAPGYAVMYWTKHAQLGVEDPSSRTWLRGSGVQIYSVTTMRPERFPYIASWQNSSSPSIQSM